jgi:hypothetical protein
MLSFLRNGCRQFLLHLIDRIEQWARESARPVTGLLAGALTDRTRSRRELIAENQLLRQQLIQVRRQIRKPQLRP